MRVGWRCVCWGGYQKCCMPCIDCIARVAFSVVCGALPQIINTDAIVTCAAASGEGAAGSARGWRICAPSRLDVPGCPRCKVSPQRRCEKYPFDNCASLARGPCTLAPSIRPPGPGPSTDTTRVVKRARPPLTFRSRQETTTTTPTSVLHLRVKCIISSPLSRKEYRTLFFLPTL